MDQDMDQAANVVGASASTSDQAAQPPPPLQADILDAIFKYVSVIDKIRLESVHPEWRRVIQASLLRQHVIGNKLVKRSKLERCQEHCVTEQDLVQKSYLTNPVTLSKILDKCKNLQAIHITDPDEPCHMNVEAPGELSTMFSFLPPHVLNRYPEFPHLPESVQQRIYTNAIAEYGPYWFTAFWQHRHLEPSPVPQQRLVLPLDELLQVLSSVKLECLDISGIPVSDSCTMRAFIKSLLKRCRKHLQHFRCARMSEECLRTLLESPIGEISAFRSATGSTCLSKIPPTLTKLAIRSLNENGFQALSTSAHLKNIRQLFVCHVSPNCLTLICSYLTGLVNLNLALSDRLSDSPLFEQIGWLENLQFLNLKFPNDISIDPLSNRRVEKSLKSALRSFSKLRSLRLSNISLEGETLKLIALHMPLLQVFDYRVSKDPRSAFKIGGNFLNCFAALEHLNYLCISCANTLCETSIIQVLMQSKSIRKLKIHGCSELIPDSNILFAAIRRAESMTIDLNVYIQLEEQMAISIAESHRIPVNLNLTILTPNDFYSTRAQAAKAPKEVGSSKGNDFDHEPAARF